MIQISDNFEYTGPKPNFERDYYKTTEDLKAVTPEIMNDGHIAFCSQTGKHYIFKSSNSVDTTYGRWREYIPIDLTLVPDSTNALGNKAVAKTLKDLLAEFKKVQEQLEGITIDDALNPDSEMPLQNKVIKQKFDAIGLQLSNLEKELENYVEKNKVEKEYSTTSTFPVTSSFLYGVFSNIEEQLKNLTEEVDLVEPLDKVLDEKSNRAVENRVINSAIGEMKEQVKDLYHEVEGLELYNLQSFCVSGWSKTDRTTPTAIEQWGNPDILRDWQFYFIDHSQLSEDGERVKPICKLQKNNLLRKEDGTWAKTVFTNLKCKGLYESKSNGIVSIFGDWFKQYLENGATYYIGLSFTDSDDGAKWSSVWGVGYKLGLDENKELTFIDEITNITYSLEEFSNEIKDVIGLCSRVGTKYKYDWYIAWLSGDREVRRLYNMPMPWEEYQEPGQGFSSLKSVVLANPRTVYLVDQVEGKSGLLWKGVFTEPCVWDGIDVSKYELKPTGMGPTPATCVTIGGVQKMFTRFVDFFIPGTNGLNMSSNCTGHAGQGNCCTDFTSETYNIEGTTYRRFIYGRSNDVSQLTNCTWARDNNPDIQKPYPFAEGGYHSRNVFVSAMEALYDTKYLNASDFFASGISANDAVSNEAQWKKYGGIRWRLKNTESWQYGTWNVSPPDICYDGNGNRTHFNALLAYWFPKEQVLESQTAASFAVEMGIQPGEEFEFYGSIWHYEDVPGAKTLREGEMNCIIYKLKPVTINGYTTDGSPAVWEAEVNLRMSLMNGYNHSGDYWIYYGGGYEQVGTVTNPPGETVAYGHPVDIYTCFDQTKWRSRDELQLVTKEDFGTFDFESDPNYWLAWSGLNLTDSYTLERPSYTAYKSKVGGSLGTGECFWSYTSKNWSSTLGQRVRIGLFVTTSADWTICIRAIHTKVHVGIDNQYVGGSLQCLLEV